MEEIETLVTERKSGVKLWILSEILLVMEVSYQLKLFVLIAVSLKLKKGEGTVYNGHKKKKGIKIHACATCDGFPLSIIISPRNEHDSKRFVEVLKNIRIKTGRRSRTRPFEVLADSAYDDATTCRYLKSRLIKSNIPVNKRNQKKRSREDL